MTAPLNLLGKWKILGAIMRDLSLARNDLIVSQDLLDHYHDKVGGSRASSRLIATRTGLARSRVSDCLDRLIDGGHFATIAGQQRGSKAKVYVPRQREAGPVHGASSAEHGPVGGSTKSPGGPVHGSTNGPVDGSTNAANGPAHGSNKTLREPCLAPRKSKGSRLRPATTDAARNPSLAFGAPGSALPVEPTPAKTIERLNAAATAGVAGGVWLSPRDLRDAHEFVFCGENLNMKEDGADFAEFDLCWTQMCAALRAGEPWATAWIKAAAIAERDVETSDEIDEERLHAIYEALKAGQAPSTA